MISKSKKIIKNSTVLYLRMIFVMAISLYTSRVVLDALGVEDFGIYNVVGGIVLMFSFLNSAMSLSVSRFMGIAMGYNDRDYLIRIFKASINIHLFLALIIALFAEIIGGWYFYNYLKVPIEKLDVAFLVFHFSVLTLIFNIIRVPYQASITINEDLNVFAILSIIESVLKLGIVYALYLALDKLMLYGLLIFMVTFIITILHVIYCRYKYYWCKIQFYWNRQIYFELFRFAGLNTFGNMVQVFVLQGQNLLLNFFFGPIVNASRGIAFQVNVALSGFITNIFTAVNPQLFKSYGEGNIDYMKKLLYNATTVSFYVLLMASIPIILDIDYILNLWLTKVPEYTSDFICLILINSLIFSNIQPLLITIHATGRIGKLHIYTGLVNTLNLILSYIFLKFDFPPQSVFCIQMLVSVCMIAVILYQMKRTLTFGIKDFVIKVYCRELLILCLSLPIPFLFYYFTEASFFRLVILSLLSIITVACTAYQYGVDRDIRDKMKAIIKQRFKDGK